MPPKKFERKEVFGQKKPDISDLDSVPYISASHANRVYEDGGLSLPDEAFIDPLEKENQELQRQMAQVSAEKASWQEQAEQLREQLTAQSSGLAVQGGGLVVEGFKFSPTGLIPPAEVNQESWWQVGELLFRLEGSIQWLIGDWLVYGSGVHYGELEQFAAQIGREYKTLRNYMVVSRGVDLSRRRDNLSFGHHEAIAHLSPDDQETALSYAIEHNLSVANFRRWLRGDQSRSALSSGDVSPFKSLSGDLDKFWQRDPSTAKRQDYEKAHQIYNEAQQAIRAFGRKWGIE